MCSGIIVYVHHRLHSSSQEMVLNCVLDCKDSLLQAAHLFDVVKESESSESNALEQIADTKKSMKLFDQQALAYKSLSEFASIILTTVQKLSSILKYFTFSIDEFEQLIVNLIARREGNRVPDNAMAISANVLYLKHQLLISIHKTLQVYSTQAINELT